ncbi:MAG: indole-3-glycerol-phosphate synthase [Candidatus Hydrothermarchaeales archaeon]
MNKNEHKGMLNFNYILEECKKSYVPFKRKVERSREPKDLITAIKNADKEGRNAIIAEIKYRSPSKASKRTDSPDDIALQMIRGGACAISVLTEGKFFGGSLENLMKVKSVSEDIPVLRKDFIFHPSQIPESYYYGADALLLISSFFTIKRLKSMIDDSRAFDMEPLVEVHTLEDVTRAQDAGARLFAINNRDKDTLKIDLRRTAEMAPQIKGVKVSASGIETPSHLKEALKYADAALVGSSIMASKDIATKVAELVET